MYNSTFIITIIIIIIMNKKELFCLNLYLFWGHMLLL